MNRGRLPRRIESHLDFHREILDVGSEIFPLSFSSLVGMRTAFLSAPVIVRNLYDTVQSSPGFRDSRTSFSLAGQPSWNRWRFLFPSAATLSSSVAFYRPVSCSIRRDASIPLKAPLHACGSPRFFLSNLHKIIFSIIDRSYIS